MASNSSSFERKQIADEPRVRWDFCQKEDGQLTAGPSALFTCPPVPSSPSCPNTHTHIKERSWSWAAQACPQLCGYSLSVLCRRHCHLVKQNTLASLYCWRDTGGLSISSKSLRGTLRTWIFSSSSLFALPFPIPP